MGSALTAPPRPGSVRHRPAGPRRHLARVAAAAGGLRLVASVVVELVRARRVLAAAAASGLTARLAPLAAAHAAHRELLVGRGRRRRAARRVPRSGPGRAGPAAGRRTPLRAAAAAQLREACVGAASGDLGARAGQRGRLDGPALRSSVRDRPGSGTRHDGPRRPADDARRRARRALHLRRAGRAHLAGRRRPSCTTSSPPPTAGTARAATGCGSWSWRPAASPWRQKRRTSWTAARIRPARLAGRGAGAQRGPAGHDAGPGRPGSTGTVRESGDEQRRRGRRRRQLELRRRRRRAVRPARPSSS